MGPTDRMDRLAGPTSHHEPSGSRVGWHLEAIGAPVAWQHSRGAGVTIAIIDEAIDTRHPEFAGRVMPGWNAVSGADDTLPRGWQPHGTKCAGVALAGGPRVWGVAPEASLLPVRVESLTGRVGTPAEARALRWAAERADVICCAWGPGGAGALPRRTRAAIEWAAERGRHGKGCVMVWAAGNEGVDLARNGYAGHPHVIAVGACNHRGVRCDYSNWGDPLWCVFPSGDPAPHMPERPIETTTPVGSLLLGETFYADTIGHTSTAAAGVAGVCGLILGANPDLTWLEVREVLREACEPIDRAGAAYDARGHSRLYGYGRPSAAAAVALAAARRRPHPPA